MSRLPHTVDVYLLDDSGSGPRMARAQTSTAVTTGVPCWVLHRDPAPVMGAAREEVLHTHRIHFKSDPGLTELNVLVWTPPNESTALELAVVADTKRPPAKGFPWVVYANHIKAG